MEHTYAIELPLKHPCYEGHFPDNPVVPGVLLLDLIVDAIGHGAPRGIAAVKFHRALAPGERCELHWTSSGSRVTFRCAQGVQMVAEGSLTFGAT